MTRFDRRLLFHGDNDQIIKYPNHTEAIKEWIDVLGLTTEPTSTSSTTLGQHQATRQSWKNDCGYVVLEAFTSLGGDHGPSDALFPAQLVVPFLGLDQAGLVDPELDQCNGVAGGGAGGASGASGAGGGEMNARRRTIGVGRQRRRSGQWRWRRERRKQSFGRNRRGAWSDESRRGGWLDCRQPLPPVRIA